MMNQMEQGGDKVRHRQKFQGSEGWSITRGEFQGSVTLPDVDSGPSSVGVRVYARYFGILCSHVFLLANEVSVSISHEVIKLMYTQPYIYYGF